jgi:ribosomal protein RSM22 (predicted rRNA methylase)
LLEGTAEKHTVTRSDKGSVELRDVSGYKNARKKRQGDLWPYAMRSPSSTHVSAEQAWAQQLEALRPRQLTHSVASSVLDEMDGQPLERT